MLISVDEGQFLGLPERQVFVLNSVFYTDGRALLANARKGVVLHHFNFHKPVKDIQFSPDGQYASLSL